MKQTLLRDKDGIVVQSNYFYTDGLFDFGTFTLPITSYGIWAPEPGFRKIEEAPRVSDHGGEVFHVR